MTPRPYRTRERSDWDRDVWRRDWPVCRPEDVAPLDWAYLLLHCVEEHSYYAIGKDLELPWTEVRRGVRRALAGWQRARAIGLRARAARIPWRLPTPVPQIMVDEEESA